MSHGVHLLGSLSVTAPSRGYPAALAELVLKRLDLVCEMLLFLKEENENKKKEFK